MILISDDEAHKVSPDTQSALRTIMDYSHT